MGIPMVMDFKEFHERRSYQREKVQIQVNIWTNTLNVTAAVFDLSGGGMSVLAPQQLPNETDVHISFELPGAHKIRCEARVVWSSETRRAGLKFMQIADPDKEVLVKWVAEQNLKALSAKGPSM